MGTSTTQGLPPNYLGAVQSLGLSPGPASIFGQLGNAVGGAVTSAAPKPQATPVGSFGQGSVPPNAQQPIGGFSAVNAPVQQMTPPPPGIQPPALLPNATAGGAKPVSAPMAPQQNQPKPYSTYLSAATRQQLGI